MDIFTQNKLLVRVISILTALNIALIGAFLWKDFFHRPPRPEKGNFERINETRDISKVLERELKLTHEQVDAIRKIRDEYEQKENDVEASIKAERDSVNNVMFNAVTNEEMIRLLARRIAENEFKMEILRFDQAKEIKSVCNPEQLEKFEKLIRELRDYLKSDIKPKTEDKPGRHDKPRPENKPERR
jgi:Spy/CpxP family protein refolding chaperone